ncbi:MAG: hypothetical protein L0H63_04115 [Nitrococcus sp.]|nr:hypothetical protein [Nitrococcus sp.]
MEMTTLGFSLAHKYRIAFSSEKTFIIHIDQHDHCSQSLRYFQNAPNVIAEMEKLTSRSELQQLLRQKRRNALHQASIKSLAEGQYSAAWRYHIASLGMKGGLRYLTYTRRLLMAFIRSSR